ncbi:hypothetical protein SNA74_04850 [Escherichia coli]|nr:hypothetical protein [Escherichia coli]MEA0210673.1 hypothetical protein [Escherichia coli]
MGSAGISQRVISSWWTFGRLRAIASSKDGLAVMVIIDSIERYRANLQQQDNYRREGKAQMDCSLQDQRKPSDRAKFERNAIYNAINTSNRCTCLSENFTSSQRVLDALKLMRFH